MEGRHYGSQSGSGANSSINGAGPEAPGFGASMKNDIKGPDDFERRSPEVIETHPVLMVNEQASSGDFMVAIEDTLGEAEAILVTAAASLDSQSGPPTPEVISTALWSIQRQFALLRCYLTALHGPGT